MNMKFRLIILILLYFTSIFSLHSQESIIFEDSETVDKNNDQSLNSEISSNVLKNYTINLSLRIYDDENTAIVNSSWTRITMSGKPVTINIKGSNLQLGAILIPYQVDENSVLLLAHGKVIIKPVDSSEGKYYSTVNSLPLKLGEKALFFPLGLLDEKMENISSCVLEIEVHHYDKMNENIDKERGSVEKIDQENKDR